MIDYDNEYNNSKRVSDAGDYKDRWAEEAAVYRQRDGVKLNIPYGFSSRMYYDYFPGGGEDAPLALFIHGGYWQMLDGSSFSHMAGGLNANGINVVVATYDLCPDVKIGEIVEQMRQLCGTLWDAYRKPIMACGHSAGGHLTASLLATDWRGRGLPFHLVQSGLAISGLFDLLPLTKTFVNDKVAMSASEAVAASPIGMSVPKGADFVAAVGGDESDEFKKQSVNIVDHWSRGGVIAETLICEGKNHFSVIDPLTDPSSELTEVARQLAMQQFHGQRRYA